jgi:hypothetical protein
VFGIILMNVNVFFFTPALLVSPQADIVGLLPKDSASADQSPSPHSDSHDTKRVGSTQEDSND